MHPLNGLAKLILGDNKGPSCLNFPGKQTYFHLVPFSGFSVLDQGFYLIELGGFTTNSVSVLRCLSDPY